MQKMKEKILPSFFNKYIMAVLICLALVCPAYGQETDTKTLSQCLKGIETRYGKKSFEADFFQISNLKALEIDETASGKAMFSFPGKMKWEYIKPGQHKIITNGTMLWIYRPDQNQVITGSAKKFFKQGAGGSFLSDISILKENYTISIKENRDKIIKLKLIPKVKTPEIQSIIIVVEKKSFNIKKIITSNIYEDTIGIEFHNMKFRHIDDSVFEFKLPENSNVINMDNQIN